MNVLFMLLCSEIFDQTNRSQYTLNTEAALIGFNFNVQFPLLFLLKCPVESRRNKFSCHHRKTWGRKCFSTIVNIIESRLQRVHLV